MLDLCLFQQGIGNSTAGEISVLKDFLVRLSRLCHSKSSVELKWKIGQLPKSFFFLLLRIIPCFYHFSVVAKCGLRCSKLVNGSLSHPVQTEAVRSRGVCMLVCSHQPPPEELSLCLQAPPFPTYRHTNIHQTLLYVWLSRTIDHSQLQKLSLKHFMVFMCYFNKSESGGRVVRESGQ